MQGNSTQKKQTQQVHIKRARKRQNFTIVGNDVYAEETLSFQAMGLLSYLLSKPDDWQICVAQLQNVTKNTAKRTARDGIYSILNELISKGFCTRSRHSDGTTEYLVRDYPHTENTEVDEPHPANPDPSKPDPSNPTLLKTDLELNTDLEPKEKNTKKESLDFGPLNLPDNLVAEFKDIRKKTKAPITQRVINNHAAEFEKTRRAGFSNEHIFNVWTNRGWKAFFYEWFINHLNSNQNQPRAKDYRQIATSGFEKPEGWQ